jgi:hypothetical protein
MLRQVVGFRDLALNVLGNNEVIQGAAPMGPWIKNPPLQNYLIPNRVRLYYAF